MQFKAKRIKRQFRQTIMATPNVIFPLLCPVREAEWLDEWDYQMLFSKSGVAEPGAVFSTPYAGEPDTIWIVTKHDSVANEVEFARVTPGSRASVLNITVEPKDEVSSYVDIAYTYTGLSPEGNDFLDSYTEEAFNSSMAFWEMSMNHFLATGKKLRK